MQQLEEFAGASPGRVDVRLQVAEQRDLDQRTDQATTSNAAIGHTWRSVGLKGPGLYREERAGGFAEDVDQLFRARR